MCAAPHGPSLALATVVLVAIVLVGVGVGCAEPSSPHQGPAQEPEPARAALTPVDTETRRAADAHAAERVELERWLDRCQVRPDDYVRSKVYTWTRADQIEALRAPAQRLLSRSRSVDGVAAAFDQHLEGEAHPLARFLRTRRITRRFAWVAPWATRMGWEGGDYGDRLIAVELREGAWMGRFFPDVEDAEERWQVRDADGAIVTPERVRAHPERVGFVFHAASGEAPDGTRRAYREVVIVNEDRVQEFSLGTPEIAELLARDAAHLERLAAVLEMESDARPRDVGQLTDAALERWSAQSAATTLVERYLGCLALAGTEYVPEASTVRSIAAALRGLPQDEELRREGTVSAPPARRRTMPHAPPVIW